MTTRRLGFGLLALVSLVVVPSAVGTQATVSATATIGGTGVNHRLTIKSTGTDPIKFWRYNLPAGVLVTAGGAQPAGWQLGAPGPLPQPTFGGRGETGIAPGGSAIFPFTTNVEFHTRGALGQVFVSATGQAGSDVDAPIGLEPPPKPKPRPCRCKKLTAELFGSSGAFLTNDTGAFGSLRLQWHMQCTGGAARCRGTLTVAPSRASKLAGVGVVFGNSNRLTCTGTCQRRAQGSDELIVSSRDPDFRRGNLGPKGRSITIEVDRFCSGEKAPHIFEIVLKPGGGLDRRRSDLNGNGIVDGSSRK